MARTVQTVAAQVPLAQIAAMFHHHGLNHLLVVDAEKEALLGLISERDVIAHSWPSMDALEVRTKTAREVMRSHPQVLTPEMEARDAALLMLRHDVSCLPVVNTAGKPIGMVTQGDLLAAAFPGHRHTPHYAPTNETWPMER